MTGSGTPSDPYKIYDVNDLQNIRLLDAACYELAADIDASATAEWFGGKGFKPLDWPFPQVRRPSGDVATTGSWIVFPTDPPTFYDKVNEVDHDGDSTYIRVSAGTSTILFSSANFNIPSGSTDIMLTPMVIFRSESASGSVTLRGYVRVNGRDYQSPYSISWPSKPPTIYDLDTARGFENNPETGLPWTVDDVNGVGSHPLQAWGVKITSTVAVRFTQIYALVYCTPGVVFTFDGKGHTIRNLHIDRASGDDIRKSDIGLFGECYGGDIKNINLADIYVKGYWYVGGVVGGMYAAGGGISNCRVSGTLEAPAGSVGGITSWCGYKGHNISSCHFIGAITGTDYLGGIVGEIATMDADLTISGCYVEGTITGTRDYIGGLLGNVYVSSGNLSVSDCYSSGSISGRSYVGGFVGNTYGTVNITNCYSTATTSGTYHYIGGFIGYLQLSTIADKCYATGSVSSSYDGFVTMGGFAGACYGTATRCFATGNVTASGSAANVGGFAGSIRSYPPDKVENCYARGDVSANSNVAGFTAEADTHIINCYSTGRVTGESNTGGFCAYLYNEKEPPPTGCFWDTETSGQSTSAGGTGKTTKEMRTLKTFSDSRWDIGKSRAKLNDGYPFLSWQLGSSPVWLIYSGKRHHHPTIPTEPNRGKIVASL
jgi:hypothetical protein